MWCTLGSIYGQKYLDSADLYILLGLFCGVSAFPAVGPYTFCSPTWTPDVCKRMAQNFRPNSSAVMLHTCGFQVEFISCFTQRVHLDCQYGRN